AETRAARQRVPTRWRPSPARSYRPPPFDVDGYGEDDDHRLRHQLIVLRYVHEVEEIIEERDKKGAEQRADHAALAAAEQGAAQHHRRDRGERVVDAGIGLADAKARHEIETGCRAAESRSAVDQHENTSASQAHQ